MPVAVVQMDECPAYAVVWSPCKIRLRNRSLSCRRLRRRPPRMSTISPRPRSRELAVADNAIIGSDNSLLGGMIKVMQAWLEPLAASR